jgi:hypothetical protein
MKKRKNHSPDFKATGALEAIRAAIENMATAFAAKVQRPNLSVPLISTSCIPRSASL